MSTIMVQGFQLAALGMGVVFLLLTLLVLTTSAMSALLLRLPSEIGTADDPDHETLAVITAALQRYQSEQ